MTAPDMPEEPVEGTIIDQRTRQIIPAGAAKELETFYKDVIMPSFEVDLAQIGTINLIPAETEKLTASLNPEEVQIRPDGLVYLPWTWYNARLNKALGLLQWGNIPQGEAKGIPFGKYGAHLVVWPHWLVVRGVTVGMAYGETTYYPANATMSFADAAEGAKSISLVRNCKILGMASELYDHGWAEDWKRQYAYLIPDPKKPDKTIWAKKSLARDPVREGKLRLQAQLIPDFYPDAKAIAAAMEKLKLTYALENHKDIVWKLAAAAMK